MRDVSGHREPGREEGLCGGRFVRVEPRRGRDNVGEEFIYDSITKVEPGPVWPRSGEGRVGLPRPC